MNPVQLYKSLADETRLRTLLLLQEEQELCVCELTTALGESQPKVSRHLAQLRQSRLLSVRKQGKWVFYQLDPALPSWIRAVIAESAAHNRDFIQANLDALHQMPGRPLKDAVCCKPPQLTEASDDSAVSV